MARGNRGQPVFKDDKDRQRFMSMGHYTRVTQAVSRMTRKPAKRLAHLRKQLQQEVEHA